MFSGWSLLADFRCPRCQRAEFIKLIHPDGSFVECTNPECDGLYVNRHDRTKHFTVPGPKRETLLNRLALVQKVAA
jgi:hypothetical protein